VMASRELQTNSKNYRTFDQHLKNPSTATNSRKERKKIRRSFEDANKVSAQKVARPGKAPTHQS
ncbi:MAG: hypothetical protein JRN20_07660, partial [Nitrososphaerota archaeon]|nr:hypothetical protein [Nitrososphaerota archaeon]